MPTPKHKNRFQTDIMPDTLPPVQPLSSVEPQSGNRKSLVPLAKIVTRLSTGERWSVRGGYSWIWIAENVCEAEVSGQALYMCATGRAKRDGDWKIEVL